MRATYRKLSGLYVLGLTLALASCGGAGNEPQLGAQLQEATSDTRVSQIVVRPKADILAEALELRVAEMAASFSSDAGLRLTPIRQTHNNALVLSLPAPLLLSEARILTTRLEQRNDVAYAEPDLVLEAQSTPNDPGLANLWNLREPSVSKAGINALDAWNTTIGDPSIVIAVLDTGILPHSELSGRVVPGYDFVESRGSNDGDGRDSNPADPGDWVTPTEARANGADARNSTWHGTHVAGIIGANGNNRAGIVGVSSGARIQPVRVLGKYGGEDSTTAAAVFWAAGGTLSGVPANVTPARVINLSLGAPGVCSQTMQNAISFAIGRGVVVVVAAGNKKVDAASFTPANCAGVIAVAAMNSSGQLASYSNWGSRITITAPGGDVDGGGGIYSLLDGGSHSPVYDNSYGFMPGTSMAAPHVSGVAALILSTRPSLSPDDVKFLIQSTARAFPTGTGRDCATSYCGAGIVNAGAAVRAATNAANGTSSYIPQSGIWWNPAESGRGFVIDIAEGVLNFGAYLYDEQGRATWLTSAGAMLSRSSYAGQLTAYSGGQTLTGAYRAPDAGTSAGQMSIEFSSATTATLIWAGGRVALQRVRFNAGSSLNQTFSPQSGIWWNPAEGGRGFALEVQDGNLMMAGFMYGSDGRPTWYLAAGPMTGTVFAGKMSAYSGGQTLTGLYRPPQLSNPSVVDFSLQFTDSGSAILRLATGQTIPLQKFAISPNAPSVFIPTNLVQTSKLLGLWRADYRYGSDFTDIMLFYAVTESPIAAGEFITQGVTPKDDRAIGGWFADAKKFLIVAEGAGYYDMYEFDLPAPFNVMSNGCYYFALLNPTRIGACYPMTGRKLLDVAPLGISMESYQSTYTKAERTKLKLDFGSAAAHPVPEGVQKALPVLARKPELDRLVRAFDAQRSLLR